MVALVAFVAFVTAVVLIADTISEAEAALNALVPLPLTIAPEEIDVALGLFGHTRGGPAQVCVASSALMGTISGSGIANVVTSGQFTIPLMKKYGYSPAFAGGVEATSSMGGQIMPPVMGAVASVSGGTLRNVFLGLKPVWISDPWITVAVLSAVLITLVFRRVTRIGKTLLVMDTFGLAIATISGSYLAFKQEVSWLAAIILGVITAVTGGLLRDVLCQVEPVLLHRETIGTSSLMGAITFVSLYQLEVNLTISAISGAGIVVITRIISIYFDLHLPKFNSGKKA